MHERLASSADPADHEAIIELTFQSQGRKQADLVSHWLERQPDAFCVLRGQGDQVFGYGCLLSISDATEEDVAVDPGVRAMLRYAELNGSPRSGEQVLAWRFLVDTAHRLQPSAALILLTAWRIQKGLIRPRCAWDFVGVSDDTDAWSPLMTYLGYRHAAGAGYEIDGRSYHVFARDWRRTLLQEWIDDLGRQELVVQRRSCRAMNRTCRF